MAAVAAEVSATSELISPTGHVAGVFSEQELNGVPAGAAQGGQDV